MMSSSSNPTDHNKKETSGGSGNNQSVKFARRTSSGRYVSMSREELDGEFSGDHMDYTVHIPPTPDNQPADGSTVAAKAEEQYVSNSLFTGGFNSVTRAHLMDKVIEGDGGFKVSKQHGKGPNMCHMPACDGKVMKDDAGDELLPCECRCVCTSYTFASIRYQICRDCYEDALKETGMCPGCREPYRTAEDYDEIPNFASGALPLPAPNKDSAKDSLLVKRNQNGEFDHNKWLFETSQGTYGHGTAYWPQQDEVGGIDGGDVGMIDPAERPWKCLSRIRPIPNEIISPYRLLVFLRFVSLVLFLVWRVSHPNHDAMWLWVMSIICELWFAFSWILDQIPKIFPINRSTDLVTLKEKFELPSPSNPTGRSDLPGIDLFVSTADPDKEPPLVTANTILSILAVEYPVEKIACYLSDDGGALFNFEAMAEAASFAELWVPFCRKHIIEPRNPESYFTQKGDPTRNKVKADFVKDRRKMKREYDEFKVRINSLPDTIRRRSEAFNAREEMKNMKQMSSDGAEITTPIKTLKATWMADGTHWPGTWATPSKDHGKGDHPGVLQVLLKPAVCDPVMGDKDEKIIDFTEVDVRLPMFVYMSREKRSGYDHNKKAGAMNALVRSSAILSNGPFILNLDCDHYFNNSYAIREGMCFVLDRGGEDICYVQFPQRFEGIDLSDRYANRNTVFFDGNMRALDGLQGPVYVGTGTMFRRFALYGFDPPDVNRIKGEKEAETEALKHDDFDPNLDVHELPKRFGNSTMLAGSIPIAEYHGRPLADHPAIKYGRPPGILRTPREPLDSDTIAEAVSVVSCW